MDAKWSVNSLAYGKLCLMMIKKNLCAKVNDIEREREGAKKNGKGKTKKKVNYEFEKRKQFELHQKMFK